MTWLRWYPLALGVALAAVIAIWQVQVANIRADHARDIQALDGVRATVQADFDAYKLQAEQANTDNALEFARATGALWQQQREQEARNDALRSQYAETSKALGDASRQLLRMLNNAPKSPESELDAATRGYYGELRRRQTAAIAAGNPPPAGNPR